mgnify:CR=1 FL=1
MVMLWHLVDGEGNRVGTAFLVEVCVVVGTAPGDEHTTHIGYAESAAVVVAVDGTENGEQGGIFLPVER